MFSRFVVALGVCALVAGATSAQAIGKCEASKLKAAGKGISGQMGCVSKAKAKSVATDPACISKVQAKTDSAIAKAGACNGSAGAIESQITACVNQLTSDVPGNGKCPASSAKAVGKGGGSELSCESKQVLKPGTFAACDTKEDGKTSGAVTKAGSCGQATFATINADIDNCDTSIKNVVIPPPTTTSSSTSTTSTSSSTTTSSSSSTTTSIAACCSAVRIQTSSNAGTLKVGGFAPFPFPAGVTVTIDAGAADAQCKHDAVVPPGGFNVPAFCIPALNYTSQVQYNGCQSGSGIGKGAVWDGHTAAHGGTVMSNVTKNADSSDGVCDPGSGICANDDNNLLGKVVTTRSAGGSGTGVATRLDLPAHSRTWQDAAGCPGNGIYNPGEGDVLITEFDFILSPTTGVATGAWVDMNANGCALPGGSSGFGAPSAQCAAGAAGPCTATGAEAAGPCCTVGQSTTTATVGEAFSNSFPLYDLGFINVIPSTITACGVPGSDTCVLTTDPCLGSASGAFVD